MSHHEATEYTLWMGMEVCVQGQCIYRASYDTDDKSEWPVRARSIHPSPAPLSFSRLQAYTEFVIICSPCAIEYLIY